MVWTKRKREKKPHKLHKRTGDTAEGAACLCCRCLVYFKEDKVMWRKQTGKKEARKAARRKTDRTDVRGVSCLFLHVLQIREEPRRYGIRELWGRFGEVREFRKEWENAWVLRIFREQIIWTTKMILKSTYYLTDMKKISWKRTKRCSECVIGHEESVNRHLSFKT